MSGFPILDLILGMVFIYFMLSLITSSVVEIALSYFKLRARVLEQWLFKIFDKRIMQPDGKVLKLGQAIMDHCTTTALSDAGSSTSYIDASNFSAALLEKLTFDINAPDDDVAPDLKTIIDRLKAAKAIDGTGMLSTELRRTILSFAVEAQADFEANGKDKSEIQRFREKVERWFDSSMDRVEGQLKKKYARPLTFWMALFTVVGLNADTVNIARYLYNNPDERAKIVAQATSAANDSTYRKRIVQLSGTIKNLDDSQAVEDIKSRQLELKKDIIKLKEVIPLGWQATDIQQLKDAPEKAIPKKLAGWLATILAVMLGAPFWFDLMNKIVNLRGAGAKPASNTDKERKAADEGKK